MRYGLVVHGPEVIDSGAVAEVLDLLSSAGEVSATLGGAMGLAALLDAGLEDRVKVVPRQLVSVALLDMDAWADAVVLLNRSKNRESGMAFGRMVVGRVADRLTKPLVQLDDGFCVRWRDGPVGDVDRIIAAQSLEVVPVPAIAFPERDRRTVSGVIPGESIWINGTVVGRATSPAVEIIANDGALSFRGMAVKEHGLEKLKHVDLGRAIIRSGSVRRTASRARQNGQASGDRVILVDHRAEDSIFRARGARAAVTVGDDTTRISASLLARLGVPVIGITDGDEDGICPDRQAAPGSLVFRLRPGNDDQLGARVRAELFGGRDEMTCPGGVDELAGRIRELAGDKLVEESRKV
jgi:hypothetical protein